VKDLVALVYGDDALYGASSHENAHDFSGYWLGHLLEDLGPWKLIQLRDVPDELVCALESQGTSEQHFRDGYEAWQACIPYDDGVIDEGNTENNDG